jgi:hypothetical protein
MSTHSLTLSAPPTQITRRPERARIVIYGNPGVGKTTFGLTFPRPIVIDTDGGLEGDAVISSEDGKEWSPDGWRDLNALYFYLKDRADEFDTIVIDSIDTLTSFLRRESTAQPTRGKPADAWLTDISATVAAERDYGIATDAVSIFLDNLRRLDKHIVLTGGVRDVDIEKGRLKRNVNVNPALAKNIEHWANVIGELTLVRQNDQHHRVLVLDPGDPQRVCKSRWAALGRGIVSPTWGDFEKVLVPSIETPKEDSK